MFCAKGEKAKSQYIARGELHENILYGGKTKHAHITGGVSYFTLNSFDFWSFCK
jgi:hypothetical protein